MTIGLRVLGWITKATQFSGRGSRCGTDFDLLDETLVPNEKNNHVKAALYTIVPRSPFFAFCTPKYFRLQKCG